MGSFFEIEIRTERDEVEAARQWLDWARDEIPRLEALYSRHDSGSAVARLNRALSREDVLTKSLDLHPELEAILLLATHIGTESGGAFDVTIGPLVEVWTEAVATGIWPPPNRLQRASAQSGSEALRLLGDGRLETRIRGLRIDLDGLSKGHVLDRLAESFRRELPNAVALLNFGESSVLAIGDPDGAGWRLALRSRLASGRGQVVLRLRDQALSVSSSLGVTSEIAGERLSHVIDPRTGMTVEHGAEAFVIANRAGVADGWSTALLVLGANPRALQLVEEAGLEADLVEGNGQKISTQGWQEFVIRP
ncbi:MAG: FAD:protein FMN transferase [Myxococcota bacterium]